MATGSDAVIEAAQLASMWADVATVYWAKWTAWAAWLGLILTLTLNAVALRLVWRQLKAAEEASRTAAEMADLVYRDTRPWITVELADDQAELAYIPGQRALVAAATVIVTNVGKTPAFDVRVEITPLTSRDGPLPDYAATLDMYRAAGSVIFPGNSVSKHMVRKLVVDGELVGGNVFIVASYQATPGGPVHYTPHLYTSSTEPLFQAPGERKAHEMFNTLRDDLSPT